jgi:hypothetical protein
VADFPCTLLVTLEWLMSGLENRGIYSGFGESLSHPHASATSDATISQPSRFRQINWSSQVLLPPCSKLRNPSAQALQAASFGQSARECLLSMRSRVSCSRIHSFETSIWKLACARASRYALNLRVMPCQVSVPSLVNVSEVLGIQFLHLLPPAASFALSAQ